MKPLVSVLMPARNAERWIEGAVTSVLTQTYRELELVVVDDGSTDRTAAIVRAFADPRVRLVESAPIGIGPASNLGLGHCRGELVARLDADDVALCDRIERQVRWLEANPDVALVGGRGLVVHAEGWPSDGATPLIQGRALHWALHAWCVLLHPTIMVRRTRFGDGYPLASRFSNDWSLFLALQREARVEMMAAPLVVYRRHAGAIGRGQRQAQDEANRDVMQDYLRRFMGVEHRPSSVMAWVRPEHAGQVEDARDLARLVRRFDPDRLALGAHVPDWAPGERARCRRIYVQRLVRIIRRAKSPSAMFALAPIVAMVSMRGLT